MSHSITALLCQGQIDSNAAEKYDLRVVELTGDLFLFHIDHYYTACWQKMEGLEGMLPGPPTLPTIFPTEIVTLQIAQALLNREEPEFAIIYTDYFGGVGEQWAQVYQGTQLADPHIYSINDALKFMGIVAASGRDEFDTVGLQRIRENPEYLEKYIDLAEELGV